MKLKMTWPHGIKVDNHDPYMQQATMVESIAAALDAGKGLQIPTPKNIIIIPAEMLKAALIEVTE
jgi:hypothetical protein